MTHYVYVSATPATSQDTVQAGSLLRLTVGAGEWQALGGGLPANAEVRALAVHPDSPQIVYAGTSDAHTAVRSPPGHDILDEGCGGMS